MAGGERGGQTGGAGEKEEKGDGSLEEPTEQILKWQEKLWALEEEKHQLFLQL